jgi:hypothetical protein
VFDDHLIQQRPDFNITKEGQMRDHIGPYPIDFFLEFFPLESLSCGLNFGSNGHRQAWLGEHRRADDHALPSGFLLMGVQGLRRRDQYWNGDKCS